MNAMRDNGPNHKKYTYLHVSNVGFGNFVSARLVERKPGCAPRLDRDRWKQDIAFAPYCMSNTVCIFEHYGGIDLDVHCLRKERIVLDKQLKVHFLQSSGSYTDRVQVNDVHYCTLALCLTTAVQPENVAKIVAHQGAILKSANPTLYNNLNLEGTS
jgi:regulator of extracellular matrix RemA (YlzA/DUF370 family)